MFVVTLPHPVRQLERIVLYRANFLDSKDSLSVRKFWNHLIPTSCGCTRREKYGPLATHKSAYGDPLKFIDLPKRVPYTLSDKRRKWRCGKPSQRALLNHYLLLRIYDHHDFRRTYNLKASRGLIPYPQRKHISMNAQKVQKSELWLLSFFRVPLTFAVLSIFISEQPRSRGSSCYKSTLS